MEPIPIEEASLRPIVSWALSIAIPIATHRILARRSWPLDIAAIILAWWLGRTSLGPYWTETPNDFVHHLAAAFCALTALAAARRTKPHQSAQFGRIAAWLLAFGIGCAVASIIRLTRIEAAAIPTAGQRAATWRLRVDPWDGHAWLAAAWATREQDDLALARAQLELAIELGAPVPESLELESELHAAHGDCALARERFDEALAARAAHAFDNPFELELGGWNLPPTLVRRCHYGQRPVPTLP